MSFLFTIKELCKHLIISTSTAKNQASQGVSYLLFAVLIKDFVIEHCVIDIFKGGVPDGME